jgi:uncharacterized membrane protein
MKVLIFYIIFLGTATWLSLEIQEIHRGWGYTLGLAGLLIAFFWAVHELTKERR